MSDEIPVSEPHQCETLYGHDGPVAAFDTALKSGRIHHGWLLAGPRGIGKASFAYLASHALLSEASAIAMNADDPVRQRINAGNETGITRIARRINEKTGKLRTQIDVEQVRDLRASLALSSSNGAWRCVIVDATEELNPSAANAILKLLEEPPARVVFFLVTHAPGRLLPTIRSRCRKLDFRPLDEEPLMAAYAWATGQALSADLCAAARGSVGAALQIASNDGEALAAGMERILAPLPVRIDREALHALADTTTPADRDEAFTTLTRLAVDRAARLACDATEGSAPLPGTASAWAETAMAIQVLTDTTRALNLDRRQALLDMFVKFEQVVKENLR